MYSFTASAMKPDVLVRMLFARVLRMSTLVRERQSPWQTLRRSMCLRLWLYFRIWPAPEGGVTYFSSNWIRASYS
jgi:hypothetical protein